MKRLLTTQILLWMSAIAFAQADIAPPASETRYDCDSLMQQPVAFFQDGTVRDRNQVYDQLLPLLDCKVDSADAELLFKGPLYSSFMSRLAKDRDVYQLTFQDVQDVVAEFRESEKYQNIKETHMLTDELSERKARWDTWKEDRKLFEALEASPEVIDQVEKYLRNNQNPNLTYLALLKKLKQ